LNAFNNNIQVSFNCCGQRNNAFFPNWGTPIETGQSCHWSVQYQSAGVKSNLATPSRSAMQQCKERLAILIREFLGMDILIEVLRLPGWRNDLNTAREGQACRYERRS
jgi:hypothetical protein